MSDRSSSTLDEDTRQPLPKSDRSEPVRVPTLTLIAHADLSRVGERVAPIGLLMGQRVALSRAAPHFRSATGNSEPLADPHVSRKPLWLSYERGTLSIDASGGGSGVRVDGQPLDGVVQLDARRLEHGVLLDMAQRALLLLHMALPGDTPRDQLGLIGASDPVQRLHARIEQAAEHERPVLVLGQSGSGKELVARAIHACSTRANGPYVAVSMAAISTSTAVAELFGYVRGAFTGALGTSSGLFRQAHGGTLLLDEIGEASPELQAMLLRAIETSEIRPLGSSSAHAVDVRIIAATDADLRAREQQGRFKLPLWHRLAGELIEVPTLRSRRDDVARLWVHFMRENLGQGALEWLSPPDGNQAWIGTDFMAGLLAHDWPGNVRELRNLAARFVLESLRQGDRRTPRGFDIASSHHPSSASHAETAEKTALPPAPVAASEKPAQTRSRRAVIDDAELLRALRAHGWQTGATARALHISRTTLYRLIEQCASVRKAKDVQRSEILAARERCSGDSSRMAAELEVSERGLVLRMRDLGIS